MSAAQVETPLSAPVRTPATGLRRWMAFGTGLGVEVTPGELRLAAVRVRPGGVEIVDSTVIAGYHERLASEWSTDFSTFARKAGVARVPVTVVLPRHEVLVRTLALPGVEDKDLASAISYQIDSLHPYPEDTALHAWSRLPGTPNILIAIARREVIDRYANLFSEAGIKVAGFTFSAAAMYSAARVTVEPPRSYLALHEENGVVEAIGESEARPVYSAAFENGTAVRARTIALGELRLDSDQPALDFTELLPPCGGTLRWPLSTAAAIANACPRLALDANLLPTELRAQSARWIYIPTILLAALVGVAAVLMTWQQSYHEGRYLEKLNAEVRTMERQAGQASKLDQQAQQIRDRIALLDRYRQRAKADADALREATNILAPPAWLQSFQLNRTEVFLAGEAEQAAALLQLIDGSPLFKDSQFSQGMTRSGSSEQFVVKTTREGPGTGLEPGEAR